MEKDNGISTLNLNSGGKVISAGGPWGAPRILFNSGIGPIKQVKNVANDIAGTTQLPRKGLD